MLAKTRSDIAGKIPAFNISTQKDQYITIIGWSPCYSPTHLENEELNTVVFYNDHFYAVCSIDLDFKNGEKQ